MCRVALKKELRSYDGYRHLPNCQERAEKLEETILALSWKSLEEVQLVK